TQKKNPIGFEGGPDPIEIIFDHSFFNNQFYSSEDSCGTTNFDNLLLGRYDSNEAFALIKFTSLPDSFYQISDVKLNLKIKTRNNFDIVDNSTLRVGKITSNDWFETTAKWTSPTDSTDWAVPGGFSVDDYELYEDLDITEIDDSISIVLPDDVLGNWINSDSTNFGIVLFTETDESFMEIYSSEYSNDNSPTLYFDFRETEEDTLSNETSLPSNDGFVYKTDDIYQKFQTRLILSNIQPIRMFTKFDLPDTLFTNQESIEDTASYLQRLTINKAELILSNNNSSQYPLEGTIYIDPYIVTSDTLNFDDTSYPMLSDDDYEDLYITSSSDSLTSDEFVVDITKIIQAYTSGEYENYGIMLMSIYENRNFINLEFDTEPTIRIIFTPPYLDE
ncbi:MAG: DNRLRE domain-containing protein, partial [Candidatus Cloacimonetes bacterium]|nr:DNRLRE domain-containing protein [Candidatus Cloacimonadota bacterium]